MKKVVANNWWAKWYASALSAEDIKAFNEDLKKYNLNQNEVIEAMIEIHDRIFYK